MKELTITIPVKSFKKFDNPYDSKAMPIKYYHMNPDQA